MIPPTDPTFQLYADSVIPALIGAGIVAGLAMWRSSAVDRQRQESYEKAEKERQAFDLAAREKESLERREDMETIRRTIDGVGARMQSIGETVVGLRTIVTGLDGRNGLKSEVVTLRELHAKSDHRLTKVEAQADEARRRLEALSE